MGKITHINVNQNLVSIHGDELVTTSLAIAEGTELDHASVIKLVRNYQNDLEEFGPLGFEIQKGQSLPQGGFAKSTEYALLNEQQSTLLITYMRNSEIVRTFKKRLVKAFYEMAQKQQSFDPATILESPEAMRGILLHYTERVIELEDVVKEQQPKVEALDRISMADGNLCITNAAKTLQVRPKDLFSAMSQHKWIYRRSGGKGWIGYQDKIQQGLITHKVTTVSLSDGTERIAEQVLVTPKGVAKLATILEAAA